MAVDSYNQLIFAYKALNVLTKDITELPAFKKGYIDKNGKRIINHWADLPQQDYINDYDIFTRFMLIIKNLISKLPQQQRIQFTYPLILKALRESVLSISDEKESTEFLIELSEVLKSTNTENKEIIEDLQDMITSGNNSLDKKDFKSILEECEKSIYEDGEGAGGMTAGAGPIGIAGINDAAADPANATVVPKKKKKTQKEESDDEKSDNKKEASLRRILDKI